MEHKGHLLTFIIAPLLTVYVKNYLFHHLGLITSQITISDPTLVITSVIYLLIALIFYHCMTMYFHNIIHKVLCLAYIALFVYLCAANMHLIQSVIPSAYTAFLYDEMPLYAMWTGFCIISLIKY